MHPLRRYYRFAVLPAAMVAVAVCAISGSPQAGAAASIPTPQNVIIMISDGCGYNQIAVTDLYQYNRLGRQCYESFPVRVAMSTYSTGSGTTPKGYDPSRAWSEFGYVKSNATDSAAAATAMSCGVKTYDAALGLDPYKNRVKHLMERAEEVGKSTGVVTTVEFSHATPAGFVAHNESRNNYLAIAQQMLTQSRTDVIMGCGHPLYTNDAVLGNNETSVKDGQADGHDYQYVGGKAMFDQLAAGTLVASGDYADADGDGVADPWTLVESLSQFVALQNAPNPPKRVCGVARSYTTLHQARSGDGKAAPYKVKRNSGVPTLAQMTAGALNCLDGDTDGFVLMVEGGAVDWAAHANQPGRLIEEEIDFNDAVDAVVRWIRKNSSFDETLLIVTGDHETGYLWGPGSGGPGNNQPIWNPIAGSGRLQLPGMDWNSGDHTNSLVPLFAAGAGSAGLLPYADETDPVRGPYIDNTEIAKLIFDLLG